MHPKDENRKLPAVTLELIKKPCGNYTLLIRRKKQKP
jgi:hypothetical protein